MRRSMKKLISTLVVASTVVVIVATWWLSRNPHAPDLPVAQETQPAPSAPANDANSNATTFDTWVRNAQTAPAMTPAQLEEGRRLAEVRRYAMLKLMRENPERALEQSLKWNEWAAL